jgi:preprotein translocase subunit YajC
MKPGEVITLVFLVAIVYVLVRPQSKAAQLVQALGVLGRRLVTTATSQD